MIYLSQLLNRPVFLHDKPYGKLVDMAIFETKNKPPISKFEIKTKDKKITVSPDAIRIENHHLTLNTDHIPLLPYDHKDFYLAEDLLDKQVIDVDGRRLVRVNDVVLEVNGELKVAGIDIGLAGILRRLGLGKIPVPTTVIPWTVIEAFDYQTGNVRIKLKQTSLNTLHPADLADILEEAGTKERLGIVDALDPRQAARAIEETNDQTQVSILENLKSDRVKEIVNKMHLGEIADVIGELNPLKADEVTTALGTERAQKIRKLLSFGDNVAGGLMHLSFFSADGEKTVKEIIGEINLRDSVPETLVITNGGGKISGIITTKDLIKADRLAKLKDILTEKKFVYPNESLKSIIRLFADYNLRVVPVVDTEKKPVGIVLIDDVLRIIEQENEDENL